MKIGAVYEQGGQIFVRPCLEQPVFSRQRTKALQRFLIGVKFERGCLFGKTGGKVPAILQKNSCIGYEGLSFIRG